MVNIIKSKDHADKSPADRERLLELKIKARGSKGLTQKELEEAVKLLL